MFVVGGVFFELGFEVYRVGLRLFEVLVSFCVLGFLSCFWVIGRLRMLFYKCYSFWLVVCYCVWGVF